MLQRLKARKHVDLLALTPRAASELDRPPKDLIVGSATEILQNYWYPGGVLIIIGAIGAVTRLVAPLLVSKEADPAVVVLDAAGLNVLPLLGGHKAGAEKLALQLAAELGGNAVLTGDSSSEGRLPLDSFGEAWGWKRMGEKSAWDELMLHQASGEKCRVNQSSGSDLWLISQAAIKSLKGSQSKNSYSAKTLSIGPNSLNDCCWHPPTLWVGIGCERNTSQSLLERAFETALLEAGLAVEAVAGFASIELKSDEPALLALSKKENRPIRFFTAHMLTKVSVPNPSVGVKRAVGTFSVAEAAAILATENNGILLKEKQIYLPLPGEKGAVTIAISNADKPFAPQLGELHLVGSGPGELAYLTNDARFALARSAVWIGYERYLDLLEPIRRNDQVRLDSQLTLERARCTQALALSKQGIRVALISSGDSGIYGMAGLALELWLEELPIDRPTFSVHPGISAMQIAASQLGAPLMNDFCAISLSDKLTPWEVIQKRLKGALIGDFVIAIYNPKSNDRSWQLQSAIDLVRQYRSASTPIAFARQMGRSEEKIDLFTLDNCPINQVDMLTTVLIGNTQSFFKHDYFVTPRGYLNPSKI